MRALRPALRRGPGPTGVFGGARCGREAHIFVTVAADHARSTPSSYGRGSALAGANADALRQVHDEDLTVADLAGAGTLNKGDLFTVVIRVYAEDNVSTGEYPEYSDDTGTERLTPLENVTFSFNNTIDEWQLNPQTNMPEKTGNKTTIVSSPYVFDWPDMSMCTVVQNGQFDSYVEYTFNFIVPDTIWAGEIGLAVWCQGNVVYGPSSDTWK